MLVFCLALLFSSVESKISTLGVCQVSGNITQGTVRKWMKQSDCSCQGEGWTCERSLGADYNESSPIPLHRQCNYANSKESDNCLHINPNKHLSTIILNESSTTIDCSVCGHPPLNITWYRQDKNLPHGAHCSPDADSLSLLLSNPSIDDCGVYVCVVTNTANEVYVHRNCLWLPGNTQCQIDCKPHGTSSGESPGGGHSQSTHNHSNNIPLVVGATAAALLVVVILLIACVFLLLRKKWNHDFNSASSRLGYKSLRLEPRSATGTVYISYAHDSDSHAEKVRAFVNKLRLDYSLDCYYFQYHQEEAREQFVFHWIDNTIKHASAYVLVWSKQFQAIVDAAPDVDTELDLNTEGENFKRTRTEWRLIRSSLYNRNVNCCIPVLIDGVQIGQLPSDLSSTDPQRWPEDETQIVDRLVSLLARDQDSSSDDVISV
ncbi:uncharacterized protein LOC134181082 isoform X2 [Corticium candelabrum]|uniref:uncharacterized protein LOC134181082 isoform X2 n=1 Tax=Corticium candelabrum TaxID=121492 RepID=UPI002E27185E|nr:uncharacterized protein LOC134181082 isoform X2 [Corticium candelabrum]